MSEIERVVKEFLERFDRGEVEFKGISNEDRESLTNLISNYQNGILKFGANSKVTRLNEKQLFRVINSLRIGGHIKCKI